MSIFDITQTPWTELVKLETFLGLEPQLGRDNFYFNTSKVTHYSALLSITQHYLASDYRGNVTPDSSLCRVSTAGGRRCRAQAPSGVVCGPSV